MKTIDVAQATKPLAEYADQIDSDTLVLIKDGEPVAALVSIQNADLETIRLSLDPEFIALIERSRKAQRESGGLSREELQKKL